MSAIRAAAARDAEKQHATHASLLRRHLRGELLTIPEYLVLFGAEYQRRIDEARIAPPPREVPCA